MTKFLGTDSELVIAKQNFNFLNVTPLETLDEIITNKVKSLGMNPQNKEINFVYSEVEFPDETEKGIYVVEYSFTDGDNEYMFKLLYSEGACLWNLNDPDVKFIYSNDDLYTIN